MNHITSPNNLGTYRDSDWRPSRTVVRFNWGLAAVIVVLLGVLLMSGCSALAPAATPQQDYINKATAAYQLVDQVTIAATSAVKANVLKGQDAANTLNVIRTARDALKAADLIATTSPSQGVNKVTLTIAILTATQTYLSTLGASK